MVYFLARLHSGFTLFLGGIGYFTENALENRQKQKYSTHVKASKNIAEIAGANREKLPCILGGHYPNVTAGRVRAPGKQRNL